MRLLLWGILVAALGVSQGHLGAESLDLRSSLKDWGEAGKAKRETCDTCGLPESIEHLARQLELQRLYIEERIRSDGGSGIKQNRLLRKGTKTYNAPSFTGGRVAAIHEHSNNIRVVGMGEMIAVLNGVEFRTRHNDYMLVMPHRTDGTYEAVEEIPYPEVPPEVTAFPNVEDQVTEMQKWFQAWGDQDYSVRDYRPYFKAALCYLEGAWTLPEGTAIDESFESDRHSIDATSWDDLLEKIKFTSYSGKKDKGENFAYLPTTIIKVTTNGTAQLVTAQWNYRILCHPLSRDLPTARLRLFDDLQARFSNGKRSMATLLATRAARFQINPFDTKSWTDSRKNHQLLDELMEEIPGKDNYIGYLEDDALGETAKKYGTSETLNAAYYHGWFSGDTDAMGSSHQHRGYADENVFMAMTSQEKVAPMSVEKCVEVDGQEVCNTYKQRWTYAIPLEMIYMTPLYKWNPHGIEYKGIYNTDYGKTVTADDRNGDAALNTSLNGTNSKNYYRAPSTFFVADEGVGDSADTSGGIMSVLDPSGEMHSVVASGTRAILAEIPEVGFLRTRYPIMPTHVGGSATWKEIEALKDMFLNPNKYRKMYYYDEFDKPEPEIQIVKTNVASVNDSHIHYLIVTRRNVDNMNADEAFDIPINTSVTDGHFHTMNVYRNTNGVFRSRLCDGKFNCPGGHERKLLCDPEDDCMDYPELA